jgi:hypothetical protein
MKQIICSQQQREKSNIKHLMSCINLSMKDSTIPFIKDFTTLYDSWQYLNEKYKRKSNSNKLLFLKKNNINEKEENIGMDN